MPTASGSRSRYREHKIYGHRYNFAEFEREVIGERIRDKIGAQKRRGKHCGGMPILGYDTDRESKRLVVNPKEARLVRKIFKRFCALGSATELARELNRQRYVTKSWTTRKGKVYGGRRWNKAHIYRLLNNRKYIGEVKHKDDVYPGEHDAIVSRKLWDEAHRILSENHRARANGSRAETPALLKGVIRCGHCDSSMGPTFTRKRGKTYRYYLCVHASKTGYGECPVKSVAAGDIEDAVVEQLRAVFRTPEIVVRTYLEVKALEGEEIDRLRNEKSDLERKLHAVNNDAGNGAVGESEVDLQGRLATIAHDLRALESVVITERDVIDSLERLDPVWSELFPAEQARIIRLLIERVEVHPDGLDVRFHADGLRSLVAEIIGGDEPENKGAVG